MSTGYNRKKQRQNLINNIIATAEVDKYQSIQSFLGDPFQTYYYPTPLQDIQQLQQLENKIKSKIIQTQNINKINQIQEQLKNQLYFVQQRIVAEEMEHEVLDGLIAALEGKIAAAKIQKDMRKGKQRQLSRNGIGCQTQEIKVKQKSIGCNFQNQDVKVHKKTKKQLFTLPAYSLTIHSQSYLPVAYPVSQMQPKKQISKFNKITNEQINRKNDQSALPKTIKPSSKPVEKLHVSNVNNQPSISQKNKLSLQSLYEQLKKQIQYLKHVKKLKNQNKSRSYENTYKQQKKKVKFLMQLFWKNTGSQNIRDNNSSGMDDNDFVLPFIEL